MSKSRPGLVGDLIWLEDGMCITDWREEAAEEG